MDQHKLIAAAEKAVVAWQHWSDADNWSGPEYGPFTDAMTALETFVGLARAKEPAEKKENG
jgi:hypothetical protein